MCDSGLYHTICSCVYLCLLSAYHVFAQVGEKFSQPPGEDPFYTKTRSMLSNLGLQNYEKNFKRGLLSDSTLPLLTDRHVVWPSLSNVVVFSFTAFLGDDISAIISMYWYIWLAMMHFSALRDVKIPPGPRLLILDHIQRSDSCCMYVITVLWIDKLDSPLIISSTSGTQRSEIGEEVVVDHLLSIKFAANYSLPVQPQKDRILVFIMRIWQFFSLPQKFWPFSFWFSGCYVGLNGRIYELKCGILGNIHSLLFLISQHDYYRSQTAP